MYYVKDMDESFSSVSKLEKGIKAWIKRKFPGERSYEFQPFKQMDYRTMVMNVRMPTHTYGVWIVIV